MNESNRVEAEMRICARLDQPGGLLDCFTKPNILHRDSQQFAARLVIFHDSKPKIHRIEGSSGKRVVADRLQVGKWK